MKLPTRTMVSSAALLVLFLALLDTSAAANTTADTPSPPPPTPSPWGKLPNGCAPSSANAAAATAEYAACAKDSSFSFDTSLARTVRENVFCRSTNCLKLFRTLRGLSGDALYCADVPGLQNVLLYTRNGPPACFGPAATDNSINTIVRPGDGSGSGSGSAGETKKPTSAPPKPTTPVPTTPEPTTLAPESPTPTPTGTPKPTTKKPSHGSSSGSKGGSGGAVGLPASRPPVNGENSSTGGDSGGMETGTIVAIVGVSIGVVAVTIALIYVTTRKTKRRKKANQHHNSTYSRETISHEQLTSYYGDPNKRPTGSYVPPRPSEQQRASGLGLGGRGSTPWHSGTAGFGTAFAGWDEELIQAVRIPYEKLTFDELMSRGGYGEVYRGTYRGELVAIKTLLPERRRDMQQIQSFLAEVKMMANMEHERIVHFIGVAWDSLEELSVVSEFLERGDLRTVLAGFEKDKIRPHGFDADKIKIALHVAHGLTYMHTLQPLVLHRDLKSRNILLDAQLNAKITDFGVSRERGDSTMTAGVGSSLWMAPEVMMGERYDEKADIFSLGVVLSELDNHVLPYAHALERTTGRRMPDAVILQMVSLGRMRVQFTDEAQSEMARIGIQCVSLLPRDRPTAAELLHLIHQASRRN